MIDDVSWPYNCMSVGLRLLWMSLEMDGCFREKASEVTDGQLPFKRLVRAGHAWPPREWVCLDTAFFCGPGRFVAMVQGSDGAHLRWRNRCTFRRLQGLKQKVFWVSVLGHVWPCRRGTARPLHRSLLKMEQIRWSPRCVWAHTSTWNMS